MNPTTSDARNFADRLDAAVKRTRSACLLGLDPHLDLLPEEFAIARNPDAPRQERAQAVGDFCCALIDLASESVPVVKPQSAFFELLGSDGVRAFERVVDHAREAGLLVIGDLKRGDVPSTAAAYARAYLKGDGGAARCDAITVNALLGADSMQPFLDACREQGAGLFVLVRTSNPGSADFQLHGDPPLTDRLAQAVDRWGAELVGSSGLSSIGAVVGATHPEVLAKIRGALPRTPLLVPGFGAQGAGAEDVAGAFLPGGRGALIASSRGVCFAYRDPRHAGLAWRAAARQALEETTAAIRSVAGL